MIIHYCEKCGCRIPPADVESGAARVNEEGKATCPKCAPPRRSSAKIPLTATPRESRLGTKPIRQDSKVRIEPAAGAATAGEPVEAPQDEQPAVSPKRKFLLIGGSAAAVLLTIVLIFALSGSNGEPSREESDRPPQQTATAPTLPDLPSVPAPANPVSKTDPSEDAEKKERKEPDSYDPRAAFAQSLLEQAKAFSKEKPDDPWTYQEKLQVLVKDHGQTAAAKEAETILATLNPGPKPADPALPAEETWLTARDLLALADPAKQSVQGKWSLDNGVLASTKGGRCKLAFPYILPEEYDLRIGFARVDGNNNLILNITHLGKPLSFHIAYGNRCAGWDVLNDRRVNDILTSVQRKDILSNNRHYVLIVQMRKNRWAAFLDGQFLVKRDRDIANLSISQHKDLKLPNPEQAGLITNDSAFRIDQIKVLEVTGTGRVLSEAESVATREPDGGTVAQPPPPTDKPVEKPIAVSVKPSAYAVWLKTFLLHWSNRNWAAASRSLEDAEKAPDMRGKAAQLKAARECLALAELADGAAAKGAATLKDGRPLTLEDTRQKKYDIGRRTKVLKADAQAITIEQEMGGGRITLNLPFSSLTAETRFALTRLGLPEDGSGKLALALYRFADCLKDGTAQTDKTLAELVDQARKASAPTGPLSAFLEWERQLERERQAAEALAGLDALVAAKKLAESQAALADFLKNFADTACLAEAAPRIPDLEQRIAALQWHPGLWGRYFSGDDKDRRQKFHFGAPILNMDQNFGGSPPAKGVPGDHFILEMTGVLRIAQAGEYSLSFHGDDNLQLILDGKDHGRNRGLKIDLVAGDHPVKLVLVENAGSSFYRFKWKLPGTNDEVKVPADSLFHRQSDTEEGK